MQHRKTALITGASGGIGQAICLHLLEIGWNIYGISRSVPRIDHPHFSHIALDLSDHEQIINKLATLPRSHAFIHAAGFMLSASLGELNHAQSRQLWQIHVHSAEILANHLVQTMETGDRIILIGSRTARGMAKRSQYTACKAAMLAMTRSWAAELINRGITVNLIAPGATNTNMLCDPQRKIESPKLPPIGRYIEPREIASFAAFLLSPNAIAMTGQEIVFCGGASLF